MTVTPSIDHKVARFPMGGAVLYSRQGSDCPDYSDCNCEDWGMSCDLETYDWYDCSDVDIAGPGDCGAASASSTGSIALSSTAAPTSTVLPSTSVLPTTSAQLTTTAPTTTAQQSFTTGIGGVTIQPGDCPNNAVQENAPYCPTTTAAPTTTEQQSFTTGIGGVTIQPGDCPNNGVQENAPYCPTSTAATSFSCGVGSNVGAATYTPATWCGCNDGNSYPTMTSASALCAYTAAPAGSLLIHPSAVPVPSTTSQPPTTQAPTSTAFDSTKSTLSCGASFGDASATPTAVPRAQVNDVLKSIEEFCTPEDPSTLTLVKGEPAYHTYPISGSKNGGVYQLAFWWDERPECANAPAPSIVASVPKGPSYWCNQYFDTIANGCDAGDGQDKHGGTLAVDCAVYGFIAYIDPDDDSGPSLGGGCKRDLFGRCQA
ncbi:MAG: hypothetical protein HETSPECPRED_000818 [Heterodermia speciosa]|uniref:Uncharacterized protein n=1 Tax=Heterodermia speciosa TaxID=116794 RepID=A0A8H3I227_9LECA|nr:MAG: hypothetical protein HETSPECPRED_000818 [Heterodermia speciosa]